MSDKKTTGPKPKTMTDYAFTMDWSKMGQSPAGSYTRDPGAIAVQTLRENIATSQLNAIGSRMAEEEEDRVWRREEKERRRLAGMPYGAPGGQLTAGDDAISKLFNNPEFIAKFAEMTSAEKMPYLAMMQSSQRRGNPQQQQQGGMDPMFLYMMSQNQNKESISMKDLMGTFTAGMESAMKLMGTQMQTQQQADPLSMMTSVLGLMKPLIDKADVETNARFKAQLDAIGKKGSLSDQIGEIRGVIDAFGGGGGATDYDLQIAKIGAETNWRAMAMTQESMNKRLEHEAEIAKYEQLGAIASTAAAAAGPGIAQAVSNLASKQALGTYDQRPQTSQTMQPHPSNRPGPQGQGRLLEATCPECNSTFNVPIPPGAPIPERITCPSCSAVLAPDV